MPEVNHAAITAWFDLLYGQTGLGGWLSLFSIDRTNGSRAVLWADSCSFAARLVAERAGTCDVWFGAAPRRAALGPNRRGGDEDCATIPGLWLDVDVAGPTHKGERLPPSLDAAHELIASLPVKPSVVVATGGGLQPWWLFTEPLPAVEAKPLLTRWGATWAEMARRLGWRVDNVFDLARVLRIPGTVNRKADPRPVVVASYSHFRYSAEDLDHWTIEPPAPPPAEARRVAYIGPERPGDAYNARHTGSEVLAQEGWTLHRRDRNGDETWLHPWAPTSDASATVYDDGHTTIWSDTVPAHWPAAETRRPYDPFGLLTVARYDGDHKKCSDALERLGYGSPVIGRLDWDETVAAERDPLLAMLVDWPPFWRNEPIGQEWLAEPLIPLGRGVALYAPAKMGKSLLALDVAAAVATGRPILGGPARDPRTVLYLDYEMTADDLHERLSDLGYGADDDLTRLRYALLPSLPPLNSKEGGKAIVRFAELVDADLVVVDTLGRAVEGEENTNDTFRNFYAHTGLHLKAAGRSLLRLDHAGKDLERGQRGGSAKNDDVDVVWLLSKGIDGALTLKATHRRLAWVPEEVRLRVRDEPNLAHLLADPPGVTDKVVAVLADLTRLGVPIDVSANEAGRLLKAANSGHRRQDIQEAVKHRKDGGHPSLHLVTNPSVTPISGPPSGSGTTPNGEEDLTPEPPPEPMPFDQPGTTPEPPGTTPAGQHGRWFPPLRGEPARPDTEPGPYEDDDEGPI